jgi:hypothetical protein
MELEKFGKDFREFFLKLHQAVDIIEDGFFPHCDKKEFDFDCYSNSNPIIEITFTTYSPGEGYSDDDYYLSVPDTIITEKGLNEFLDELRRKKAERIEEEQKQQRQIEEKEKKVQEEKERKELKRLQNKYEVLGS